MQPKLSALQIWLLAARPRTLPAAIAPVIVGVAAAYHNGFFDPAVALAILACAVLLQIGANIVNDVFDFYRGADTQERLGPPRVTAQGLLQPHQTVLGAMIIFAIAALVGLCLVYWVGGLPILLLGLLAIAFAVAYSPLAYIGLGDLLAFMFFGPVAVVGTYYLLTGSVNPLAIWVSLPMGLLVTAILVVNNLRDVEQDRKHNKRTLAARWGVAFAQAEWTLLVIGSFLLAPMLIFFFGTLVWLLATWLAIPAAYKMFGVIRTQTGRALNAALSGTAQLTLLYAVLLATSLVFARLVHW